MGFEGALEFTLLVYGGATIFILCICGLLKMMLLSIQTGKVSEWHHKKNV